MTNHKNVFVSLDLCNRLHEFGLTQKTWASYRQYSASEPKLVFFGSRPTTDLAYVDTPAYTVMDMITIIPGASICQLDEAIYDVAAFKIYSLAPQRADNLPDAAALMVLHILEKRLIAVETMNDLLLSLNPVTASKS